MNIEKILKEQNIEELKYAIEKGLNISEIKIMSFIEEIEEPNLDFFQFLIDNGIDIDEKDGDNVLCNVIIDFDFVIKNGLTKKHREFINFLIQNNIDLYDLLIGMIFIEDIEFINIILDKEINLNDNTFPILTYLFMPKEIILKKMGIQDKFEWSNREEIIQLLIDRGDDINISFKGMPSIVFACMFSDIEIIQLLIDNGANIDIEVQDGIGISLFSMILMMNQKLFKLTSFNKKDNFDILLFSNFEKNSLLHDSYLSTPQKRVL